jgi:hypothetical protein
MRSIVISLAAAVLSALSLPARAILPESGWYWNPAQSGRGFNIEIQNNLLFVAAFAYDSFGQPTWYVAGGQMASDRSFSGRVNLVTGGQCFGCPYFPPSVADAGPISITFHDEGSATIVLLGEAISIRRQDYASLTITPDALYGEWSTTEGEPSFPVYHGERISLAIPFSSGGFLYAAGQRTGDSSLRVALGRYDSGSGSWIILLDSSTSYYRAYRFRFAGLNRIEGQTWTYLKSELPSGSGLFFLGHRTKSKARVNGISAPGATKAEIDSSITELLDAARASQVRNAVSPGSGPPLEAIRQLQAALERGPQQ